MGTDTPDAWARGKRDKAARYVRELGPLIARASAALTPGVPVAAHCGFAVNGSRKSNTTGWLSCSADERAEALREGRKPLGGDPRAGYGAVNSNDLHELGPWGVEGNRVPELVASGSCPWASLATSDGVRAVLGRDGATGAGWYDDVDAQVVIGVANLARHSRLMNAKLPAALRWDDAAPWTLWRWFLTSMAWSAGEGGTARHVGRYIADLSAASEASRVAVFARRASTYDGEGAKHRRPSYSVLRGLQKIAAGSLAATLANDAAALAWLRVDLDDATTAAIVRSASA